MKAKLKQFKRQTEYRSSDEFTLHRMVRLKAVLAAKDTQLAVVVADEFDLTHGLTASVAEVGLAPRAGHVIAPRRALDEHLES